jgi:predicted nucleotidyltransferase
MIPQPVIETIKTTVHSIIPGARIILFGSMAKGTATKGSDYDILVISKTNIPKQEKGGWRSKIDRALVYALDAPVDIVLNSEEEVERKKDLLGHVVKWAVKDGIEL